MADQSLEAIAPTSDAIDRYETEQPSAVAIRSLDDIKRISTIFIGSGMFKGTSGLNQQQQLYQAGVKIIAGVEFGIQPFAAMRGINIINGNAEMSANLMAAKVKKHPKYDYKVRQLDNQGCVIAFFEIPAPGAPRSDWEELGESSFTHEDAVNAQLARGQNWQKFARNMYFARAMSNGVRFYTPDVFYGAPVYVEGEIGGSFDQPKEQTEQMLDSGEAEIVDAAAPDVDQMGTIVEPLKPSRAETKKAVEALEAEMNDEPTTDWDAHDVAATMGATDENIIEQPPRRLDPKKTAKIYALGSRLGLDRAKLEKRVSALKDNAEASEAIAILQGDLDKKEAQL